MAELLISRGSSMSTDLELLNRQLLLIISFNMFMPNCLKEGLVFSSTSRISCKEAVGGGVIGSLSNMMTKLVVKKRKVAHFECKIECEK
jgi:hypothetical protein